MRQAIEYLKEIGRWDVVAFGDVLELDQSISVAACEVEDRVNTIT
jgi:hypothetical protein